MSKPQYLTQDDKGWKLRRPIPKELRELAGKASFVERVGRVSQKSAYEQARVFGVATDLKFETLRSQLQNPDISNDNKSNEPGFNLKLDRAKAKEIASAYFYEKEEKHIISRSENEVIVTEDNITDAQMDLDEAQDIRRGGVPNEEGILYRPTSATAIRQLVKYGYLSKEDMYDADALKLPKEIILSDVFKILCRLLEDADVELAERRLRELERGGSATITNKFFEPMILSDANPQPYFRGNTRHSLKQLVDAFLAAKELEVGKSRRSQYNIPLRFLIEYFGEDKSIVSFSREECDEFVNLLSKIPPHATQHYKNITVKRAIAKYEKSEKYAGLNTKEGQKKLYIIKSVFELALDKEWLNKNPFERLKILTKKRDEKKFESVNNGYEPFDVSDLNKIFNARLYTGCLDDARGFNKQGSNIIRRERYWTPVIALFTGMRMNEILQLEKADIKKHDNIWYFEVTDEEEGEYNSEEFVKRLKTKSALRSIPVHQRLLDFGFLDWVNARGKGRLFPDAMSGSGDKPSFVFSKKFATFIKAIKVWQPRKRVFHSFRNNFNDALRRAEVRPEIREAINGWKAKHEMDAKYGIGHSLEVLNEEINKISYEGLDLKHLEPEEWQKHLIEKRFNS
uniref:Tyr recombinase domain-containing protein n=1 Tax=OCS116 cluster bacterium TaxID=2030921 RepID=A0A2A4YQ06_9PROT